MQHSRFVHIGLMAFILFTFYLLLTVIKSDSQAYRIIGEIDLTKTVQVHLGGNLSRFGPNAFKVIKV